MRFLGVGFAVLGFGTCQVGTAPPSDAEPEVAAAEAGADEGASAEAGAPAEEGGEGAPAEEGGAAEGEGAPAEEGGAPAEAGAEGGGASAEEGGASAEEGGEGGTAEPAAKSTIVAETPTTTAEFALPKKVYTKVDGKCGKDKGVGTKLKSFKLATTKGKSVTNRSFGDRVLVVNFWGTWCKPCLKELPEFDRLYRRYRKHGLVVLAIATDEDAEPVQAFVDSRKLSSRVLIGGEDYAGQYGAPTFPFTYVVDAGGTIRASYHGYKPECMGKLEADIREQLEKRAAKK